MLCIPRLRFKLLPLFSFHANKLNIIIMNELSENVSGSISDNLLPTNAITSVLQLLRSPQSYAVLEALHLDYTYITSAGSRGYCAFKEMLQNGILGHAMMVESHDLTTVDKSTIATNCTSSDGDDDALNNIVVFRIVKDAEKSDGQEVFVPFHMPPGVAHLKVYTNHDLPREFLAGFKQLKTIDFSALPHLTELSDGFLSDCSGLETLDLSPFSHVTRLHDSAEWDDGDSADRRTFLARCTSLKTLDLAPFSNIKYLTAGFLRGCTGLETIDLHPLSNIQYVATFLEGCTGLTALDLSPLTKLVSLDLYEFLQGCPSLKHITLSNTHHMSFVASTDNFGDVEVVCV